MPAHTPISYPRPPPARTVSYLLDVDMSSHGSKLEEGAPPQYEAFDPASLRVPYGDWERAVEVYTREGVVVLTGTFDSDTLHKCRMDAGKQLEALCGVDMNNPRTWTVDKLPPQVRLCGLPAACSCLRCVSLADARWAVPRRHRQLTSGVGSA